MALNGKSGLKRSAAGRPSKIPDITSVPPARQRDRLVHVRPIEIIILDDDGKDDREQKEKEQNGPDYVADVISYLRLRESLVANLKQHPPHFRRQSPQLDTCRRRLVDWTCQVGERLALGACAVHLAVRMVDLFMDGHFIDDAQLYLVCLVALMLAAKMEEKDSKVPRVSVLNTFVKTKFPPREFMNVETIMMSYFQWNLTIPTAEHFIDLVFPYSYDPSTDLLNGFRIRQEDGAKVGRAFYKFIRHFADTSLQDDQLIAITPSAVAAAVIYCARLTFDLSPPWTERLGLITVGRSPQETEVNFAYRRLMAAYNVRVGECTPPRPKRRVTATAATTDTLNNAHFTSAFETPPPSAHRSSSSSSSTANTTTTTTSSSSSVFLNVSPFIDLSASSASLETSSMSLGTTAAAADEGYITLS